MKLSTQDFKRFRELALKVKKGTATEDEKAELAKLQAMKNDKGSNDISWWKNYPDLLKDVVNIAFNYIPGTDFPFIGITGNDDSLRFGVLAKATLRPGIGRSVSDADAFNAQIRQLWLDMHRKYRGIGTYEKADLAMMILAVNSVFETIAKFERVYGVINTYHVGNRAVPYALKEALNISNSLEADLADFRYQLNLRISKVKQLCLPKGLSVLMSDIVAVSNIFKDSADRRAFMYLFDPDVFGVYDATSFTSGGAVAFKKYSKHQSTTTPGGAPAFSLGDICAILDLQINALLNDDDIARMCSDLIAAYGPENVMQLNYLPDDYKVEPVEDYERLVQFNNLTICGPVSSIYESNVISPSTADIWENAGFPIIIYQHNNTVYCRLATGESTYTAVGSDSVPTIDHSNRQAKNGDLLFNTWVENPGEVELMCGSRYSSLAETRQVVDATHWRQEITAFGSKVCCSVTVYWFNETLSQYQSAVIDGSVYDIAYFRTSIVSFMKLTQMDWHPTVYVDNSGDLEVFGDIDNIARFTYANLSRIHEVALLSGYYIPLVAKD